jgi:hypothetical protein
MASFGASNTPKSQRPTTYLMLVEMTRAVDQSLGRSKSDDRLRKVVPAVRRRTDAACWGSLDFAAAQVKQSTSRCGRKSERFRTFGGEHRLGGSVPPADRRLTERRNCRRDGDHNGATTGRSERVHARTILRGCVMAVLPQWLAAIGKPLRDHNEDVTGDPLPRRWVDLIHHLNEQERRRSQRCQRKMEHERSQ